MSETLLQTDDVHVHFPISHGLLRPSEDLKAVRGVSLEIGSGETLGIVGESGCGKSTLARAILRLVSLHAGDVIWLGENLTRMHERELGDYRREAQLIFQNPVASLDPRMRIADAVAEPLRTHFPNMPSAERDDRVARTLEQVGIDQSTGKRFPHEVSGGQAQRVGIARALITNPKLIVCDEAVAALDVSIKAQIINLLKDIQERTGIALIFISHDLAVVRQIAARVMILYLGQVMEQGAREAIFDAPMHPYTRALLAAVPSPDPRLARKPQREHMQAGELASAINPPAGCPYGNRCPRAQAVCESVPPPLEPKDTDAHHMTACHFPVLGERL